MSTHEAPFSPLSAPPLSSLAILPMTMRLLCVAEAEPSWVSLTLRLDAAGCQEPQFRWAATQAEALGLLRNDSFDCVLIDAATVNSLGSDAVPDCAGVLRFVQAIRTSGCDDAIVVLADGCPDPCWAELARLHCDVLVSVDGWDATALVPVIQRSVGFVDVWRENHRLGIANQRRLLRERDEAAQLLDQQRRMIVDPDLPSVTELAGQLAPLPAESGQDPRSLISREVDDFYQELLRTYVIMGSGSLSSEIGKLADLLSLAQVSPREALDLHVQRVESLVRGLGRRSSRHVMARADLLALELMMNLAERFQQQASTANVTSTDQPDPDRPVASRGDRG